MNVTSEIKSYIELKETCGALLLTGKWGCGKSYIMHQLADSLNGEDQYAVAIVSLFGVQSIEELDKKVKEAIRVLEKNTLLILKVHESNLKITMCIVWQYLMMNYIVYLWKSSKVMTITKDCTLLIV